MALAGYPVEIFIESSRMAFTAEATSTTDNTTYQITDVTKRIFAFNTALTVLDGGTATTEAFTVDNLSGSVTFASADPARVITLTGSYVVLTSIATAKSYSMSLNRTMVDITNFNQQYRTFEPALIGGTIDITRWYLVDHLFFNYLTNTSIIKVISFNLNQGAEPFLTYALPTSDEVNANVEGIIEESLSFQITNRFKIGAN